MLAESPAAADGGRMAVAADAGALDAFGRAT